VELNRLENEVRGKPDNTHHTTRDCSNVVHWTRCWNLHRCRFSAFLSESLNVWLAVFRCRLPEHSYKHAVNWNMDCNFHKCALPYGPRRENLTAVDLKCKRSSRSGRLTATLPLKDTNCAGWMLDSLLSNLVHYRKLFFCFTSIRKFLGC
jgi:hypothetical protein